MNMMWFFIGEVVGVIIAFIVLTCCRIAKESDERGGRDE